MLRSGLPGRIWADIGNPAFLAAGKTAHGFVLYGLSWQGQSLFQLPRHPRSHTAGAHPTRTLPVAFARRPGNLRW